MKLGSTHLLRGRGRASAAFAASALLALPIVAEANHWPVFGGDAGHSGYQAGDMGQLPLGPKYDTARKTGGKPQTSTVITGAPEGEAPRAAFATIRGTSGGNFCEFHIFKLDDSGARLGAAEDLCPSGDEDAFGERPAPGAGDENTDPTQGSVTPVSSSEDAAFGQLFVVHNAPDADAMTAAGPAPSNNDIAIAQFDEASGELVTVMAVGSIPSPANPFGGATQGFEVESSPVLTPPLNDNGDRALFFVAQPDPDNDGEDPSNPKPANPRLFKLTIPAAQSEGALDSAPAIATVDVPGANPYASPSIAYLQDPSRGDVIPYVVVSGSGTSGGTPTGTIQTFKVSNLDPGPQAPTDGSVTGTAQTVSIPGTAAGGLAGADPDGPIKAPALYAAYQDDEGTVVRRFVQQGDNGTLTMTATSDTLSGDPARALALSATADGGETPALAVVTTGTNLYTLDLASLAKVDAFQDTGAGESLLTPGTTGFARNTPAVTAGRIHVARDNGNQLVLRLTDAERVCRPVDVSDGTCSSVEFTEHPDNNNSTFAIGQPGLSRGITVYLSGTGAGNGAVAGLFAYVAKPSPVPTAEPVTAPPTNKGPIAAFVYKPAAPKAGRKVTFDASSSSDPDGKVTGYRWDLDGNGSFETNTGASPIATKVYKRAKTYVVKLRVNDAAGATSDKSVAVKVGPACSPRRCATRLSAKVRPRRDAVTPLRFTTTGRISLPAGVSRAAGCKGKVSVQVKVRKKTISTRRAKVRPTCRFRSKVTFTNRSRTGSIEVLRFVVRFHGNTRLLPKRHRVIKVKIA